MKKIHIIIAVCAAVFLTSCGQRAQTAEVSQTPQAESEVTDERLEIEAVGNSDESYAAVDAIGNVVFKTAGKVVITAASGDANDSCNLSVASVPASSVSPPSTTVSSSTSSPVNDSGVFAGYKVTVTDTTTIATTSYGDASFSYFYFYSDNGKALGSISGGDMLKILQQYQANGTAPYESSEYAVWFAEQFNLYRGLSNGTGNSMWASPSNTIDVSSFEAELFNLTNTARRNANLRELELSSDANELARVRAEELASNYSHARPDGSSVSEFGYGENYVKRNSAQAAFESWMNSSGHKENILRDGITTIGIGVYQAPNGDVYCIQLFAY